MVLLWQDDCRASLKGLKGVLLLVVVQRMDEKTSKIQCLWILTDVIILLLAAVILVPISRLIRLGAVPGFLIAGIVVGPSSLGLIDNQAEIAHLGELGVVLLMLLRHSHNSPFFHGLRLSHSQWTFGLLKRNESTNTFLFPNCRRM